MRNNWGLALFYHVIFQNMSKHSLNWTGSIQQEVKGRVRSAGAIRSNQGFVGRRQNMN